MEACGAAQHWAREFAKLGHEAKLIAPQFVRPFVKTNKNDAADCAPQIFGAARFEPCGSLPRSTGVLLAPQRSGGARPQRERIAIPNSNTKSVKRKRLQKKRWFRNAQKWRIGAEGRISLLKRRHGLNRCRYKGLSGMQRWVGLGVIGDNLINIGHALAASAKR